MFPFFGFKHGIGCLKDELQCFERPHNVPEYGQSKDECVLMVNFEGQTAPIIKTVYIVSNNIDCTGFKHQIGVTVSLFKFCMDDSTGFR